MPGLLHLSVSPRRAASQSRRAGARLVAGLQAAIADLQVVARDLAHPALPHPDEAFARASLMMDAQRGPAERAALALSETLLGELEAADIVAIDTPMHNFTVPSPLKAWIDYVVRPRRSFGFADGAKVGLLRDRPVLVVVACGGRFGPEKGAQADFLTPYLRYVLGTIGLASVAVRRLEALGRGDAMVDAAFAGLDAWIADQVARVGADRLTSVRRGGMP